MRGILLVKVTLNGEGRISESVPREDSERILHWEGQKPVKYHATDYPKRRDP
jgi:hypothetical protein